MREWEEGERGEREMRECEEGESERKEEETEGKRGGGREGKTERERGRWNALIRVSKRLECSGGGVSMFVSESDLKGSEYWQNIHNKRKTYRATWEEQRLFL